LVRPEDGPKGTWAVSDDHLSPAQWAWLRRQIVERPKWVAERVAIEQIGCLTDLKKPTVSPSLTEVGDLYFNKAKVTDHWRTKCRTFWGEFRDAVGVPALRDLTQEAVADYKAEILEASESPTYAKHRFGAIKTVIAFSKQWGKWAEDRTRALGYCSILIPPTSTSLDPRPIDPADFHKLLAKADTQMRAMLLLALNACLYAKDVADLKPDDLDLSRGVLVADRGKTGVARVAVLWPATVEAVRKLDVRDGILFRTDSTRQAHNANTIRKAFRDLRGEAEVSGDVQFAHIRDGAYTFACEGEGVQFEHARVRAGHRSGISDNYVKRRPALVTAACSAVAKAYGLAAS
jgi:integrase